MARKPTPATTTADENNTATGEQTGGIRPRITDPESNTTGSDSSVDDDEPQDHTDGDEDDNDTGGDESSDDGDNVDQANRNIAAATSGGDGVTNVTQDGVTNASSDGATGAGAGTMQADAGSFDAGTPDKDLANTQEGPTPVGKHGDTTDTDAPAGGFHGDPTGPKSLTQAAQSAFQPAGTMSADTRNITAATVEVLSEFATKKHTASPTSNIHDDLGIARADVTSLSDAIGKKFGVVIFASEAQNFLLVRDIINLVVRKLQKQATDRS